MLKLRFGTFCGDGKQEAQMKRTTILLGDADRRAIQAIKDRFGVSSDSDAIRLAVRVIATVQEAQLLTVPTVGDAQLAEQERAA